MLETSFYFISYDESFNLAILGWLHPPIHQIKTGSLLTHIENCLKPFRKASWNWLGRFLSSPEITVSRFSRTTNN